MKDDLLPCPFCGDPNPAMQGRTDNALHDFQSAWVECETCGVTSKGFYRTADAADAWNTRAA